MDNEHIAQTNQSVKSVPKNLVLSGIVGIMIVVSLFQSFQLSKLQGYTKGLLTVQSVKASAITTQTATPLPTRPAASGLPSQVGGC